MSLPSSIIVNVQTDIPPFIDTSTGQNTALFLTEEVVATTPDEGAGSEETAQYRNTNAIDLEERIRPYYDANTVGTDLGPDSGAYSAAVAYFSQNPHPRTLYVGVRGEGEAVEEALGACLSKYQFYGVVIDHDMSDEDAMKAAAWVQAQIMLYGRSSSDPGIYDPTSDDDFAYELQAMSRAFAYAREDTMTDYPEMATISRTIGVDLRMPGSAITIGVQPLQSIQPSGFTQAQFHAITKKNCNVYQVIGPNPVVFPGVMANGLFIEDQFGIDFLQAYITLLAISGIERSRRLSQTDQGMNFLVGYLDTGLVQVVASGFLAPGYWDAATINGVVENGELLAKGYKIIAAPIRSLTPDQRAAGFGSNIGIALKGSGAIHCLNIYMPFNP